MIERWIFILVMLLKSIMSIAQETECKTPIYLNQFDGFMVASCQFSEYNEYKFTYNNLSGDFTENTYSGNYYRINYERSDGGSRELSGAQIRQNYYSAVMASKGENLSSDKNMFKFRNENKVIWMLIENAWDDNDLGYQVYIIEETIMEREIALNIREALKSEGKIALYGIFFDVDKSVIRPESEPELKTLLDYLITNSGVKVFIVGHTDGTGDLSHNMTLSKERAKSVVDYLVSKGIDSKRLSSDGVGPLCPVSTNLTEEGKQKNRRVEVVLQ